MRICIDLDVWCGAFLSQAHGRQGTATQTIIEAARSGVSDRGPVSLVVSWGMLQRLETVLVRDFQFPPEIAKGLIESIGSYAVSGPSLTLGGIGVLPIHDGEDRHVLETAWGGRADVLTTSDLRGFINSGAEAVIADRAYRLRRADQTLIVAHPFEVAGWLRGVALTSPVPMR